MNLSLIELPGAADSLEGLVMELKDSAYDCLESVEFSVSQEGEAFKDADVAILVGAKPRSEGMERADLLKENALIFKQQG